MFLKFSQNIIECSQKNFRAKKFSPHHHPRLKEYRKKWFFFGKKFSIHSYFLVEIFKEMMDLSTLIFTKFYTSNTGRGPFKCLFAKLFEHQVFIIRLVTLLTTYVEVSYIYTYSRRVWSLGCGGVKCVRSQVFNFCFYCLDQDIIKRFNIVVN